MQCNEYQIALYDQLMELNRSSDIKKFFHKDLEFHDDEDNSVGNYRIFNYRGYPSYADWCKPGALESRGVMYKISDGKPTRLVCHPMAKFFNLNENPFTTNVDLSTVSFVEDKADGSLISSFLTSNGRLRLKSKASLDSPQAIDSMKWLNKPENTRFKNEMMKIGMMYKTVNMEWVSPLNRIVVDYSKSELRVLNIRSNTDGFYLDYSDLPEWATEIRSRWTKRIDLQKNMDLVSFLESTSTMQNIEGFVVELKDKGLRIKIKTDWYRSLHGIPNSIASPLSLFKAVLNETTDDLKAKLHTDIVTLQKITKMEDLVQTAYQNIENEIEHFHNQNQKKSKKDYAITAQKYLDKNKLFLAIVLYNGVPVPYKKYLLALQDKILKQFEEAIEAVDAPVAAEIKSVEELTEVYTNLDPNTPSKERQRLKKKLKRKKQRAKNKE